MHRGSLCSAAAYLSIALGAAPAVAQRTPPDDARVSARLDRIERALAREEESARLWRGGWLIGFGALAIGQGAFAAYGGDEGLRIDAGVGAAKSALGFASTLFRPWSPASAAQRLAELPGDTPAQRRLKLARAEALLRDAARDEALGTGLVPRLGASVVNLAGAYYLWLVHERWASGWLSIPPGLAVSELQLRTQPTRLVAEAEALQLVALPVPGGASLHLAGRW